MTTYVTQRKIENLRAENAEIREITVKLLKRLDNLNAVTVAASHLITYRDAAGPLGFQLEKADDFINELRAAITKAGGE